MGIVQPVRVDDGCYIKLTEKSRGEPVPLGFDAARSSKTLWQHSMQPRDPRIEDPFDTDLKRALAMSLEEVAAHSSNKGVRTTQESYMNRPSQSTDARRKSTTKDEVADDADLKAAIAASLKDMEDQKLKHAQALRSQQQTSLHSQTPPLNKEYELKPVEAENIHLFSTLVDRLQHQAPGTVLREPQILELYESISQLRPKLARSYGETMSKHGEFAEDDVSTLLMTRKMLF